MHTLNDHDCVVKELMLPVCCFCRVSNRFVEPLAKFTIWSLVLAKGKLICVAAVQSVYSRKDSYPSVSMGAKSSCIVGLCCDIVVCFLFCRSCCVAGHLAQLLTIRRTVKCIATV